MPIKITLELSDEDLSYYSRVMDDVWKRNRKRAEKEANFLRAHTFPGAGTRPRATDPAHARRR